MIRTIYRLTVMCTLMSFSGLLHTAHAGEALAPLAVEGEYVILLPDIDRATLIEDIGALRSQLIQRKQMLARDVASKKLDSGDAVITAIMPGGLLYAGYKKMRYEQARSELDTIGNRIEELSADLLALEEGAAPAVLAQLH